MLVLTLRLRLFGEEDVRGREAYGSESGAEEWDVRSLTAGADGFRKDLKNCVDADGLSLLGGAIGNGRGSLKDAFVAPAVVRFEDGYGVDFAAEAGEGAGSRLRNKLNPILELFQIVQENQ